MLEAAIIGLWRSTAGLCSMRRAMLRLRRFNWRWTLAFTRKPPGGRIVEVVKYLNCSPKPGGFRVFGPRSASHYAWFETKRVGEFARTSEYETRVLKVVIRLLKCSHTGRSR